jgi:hypothetical protein
MPLTGAGVLGYTFGQFARPGCAVIPKDLS